MDIFYAYKRCLCTNINMKSRKYIYALNMYDAVAEISISRRQIE